MSTPTVSASLNKSSYAPGETATLTVTYGDADNKTIKVTVQVQDSTGAKSDPVTIDVPVVDKGTVSVTDSDSHVWTKVSDNGSVAVYTTKV